MNKQTQVFIFGTLLTLIGFGLTTPITRSQFSNSGDVVMLMGIIMIIVVIMKPELFESRKI